MTKLVELPDVDEINQVVKEIYRLKTELSRLKLELKIKEAAVVFKVSSDTSKKQPSMNFIQSTYLITGLEGELISLREKIAQLEPQLDYYERKYDFYKLIVDIWRTQSANERLKV
jgi:hypothetical protein